MAEIPYVEGIRTVTEKSGPRRHIKTVSWSAIALGDTCQEYPNAGLYPDKTVEVDGTFGGASVAIQGRNDPARTQKTMQTADGVAASYAAAGGALLRENYGYLTPLLTGGGGTTSLNVTICLGT